VPIKTASSIESISHDNQTNLAHWGKSEISGHAPRYPSNWQSLREIFAMSLYDLERAQINRVLAVDIDPSVRKSIIDYLTDEGSLSLNSIQFVGGGTNSIDTNVNSNFEAIVDLDRDANLTVVGNASLLVATGKGNDVVDMTGSSGNAVVMTGSGNDTVLGGSGADSIYGGNGNDLLIGGSGDHQLLGGGGGGDQDGFETLPSGEGGSAVSIWSPSERTMGANFLWNQMEEFFTPPAGGNGRNWINQADGNDTLVGGSGSFDTLQGGGGDDLIISGSGANQLLLGGGGNDTLVAGTGANDTINGGNGNDQVVFDTSFGDASIATDQNGVTTVTFSGTSVTISDVEQLVFTDHIVKL
jgi:Ca2+-binding RTX toxin-like protein